METTFHTHPSLPPLKWRLGRRSITKLAVSSLDNNVYLIDTELGIVVIDAADDVDAITTLIGAAPLAAIITTHRHHDHIRALPALSSYYPQAALYAGEDDVEAIYDATGIRPRAVKDGEILTFGSLSLNVICLVGHTPGSIALACQEGENSSIFTGDSLFPGGVGKTNSAQDFTSLLNDVIDKIFNRFDDMTIVHPGHGDATTLGRERPYLEQWRQRGW